MARKLKVYRTSIGFFDLAVAAPSMKAAAEAWGSDPDIFRRGFAEESRDPGIVTAALASPGVVLRRPVGSDGAFSENAALPKAPKGGPRQPDRPADRAEGKRKADAEATDKGKREKAALAKAEKRLVLERRKRQAEEARAKKLRDEMITRANAAFDKAKARHQEAVQALAKRRNELDEQAAREDERWEREQRDHSQALKEAGRGSRRQR